MSRFLFTGTSCVYTKRCIYIYICVYIFFKRSQDVREPWIVDSSLTYSDRWGFVHLEPLENYLQINRCFHYKVFMKKLTRKHMNRNARGPSTSYFRKSKTWQRCRFRVSGLYIYIYIYIWSSKHQDARGTFCRCGITYWPYPDSRGVSHLEPPVMFPRIDASWRQWNFICIGLEAWDETETRLYINALCSLDRFLLIYTFINIYIYTCFCKYIHIICMYIWKQT